jgi:tRNA threonylcarbamoyladenosine biosynthesis protein TsaB
MNADTQAPRWLAFDTSTDVLSLAVARGHQVWTQTLPGGAQSSSGLIPAVLSMLAEADMPLASLTAIVFGRGPGSFTGLRTACAVAQGLAFGADIPVLPVDTLLAVAEEARWQRVQGGAADADLSVLAMLDARMDEVYSAAYQWSSASRSWQGVSALQVSAPENVQATGGPLLAGNVFEAYGPRLAMPGERCQALPTAAALLRLAPSLWAQGLAVPADQAMPLYIRDKVANTTAEREAMKAKAAQLAQTKAAETP